MSQVGSGDPVAVEHTDIPAHDDAGALCCCCLHVDEHSYVCSVPSEFVLLMIQPEETPSGQGVLFEGTLVIGLILRSLWGLYKIHETLWFYLVSL